MISSDIKKQSNFEKYILLCLYISVFLRRYFLRKIFTKITEFDDITEYYFYVYI